MIAPTPRTLALCLFACAAAFVAAGCNAPGKPGPEPTVPRPEQVLDFKTLYAQNCASCHGVNGWNGAAISLANPIYLAIAGAANIQRVTADGVPGTAMPPFAKSKGGMLTDQQIAILTQGMEHAWGNTAAFAGQTPPAYAAAGPGDPSHGQQVFATYCAGCHGADATGGKTPGGTIAGPLVDPAFLALISDQGLRTFILSGQPEQEMPAFLHHRNGAALHSLTDPEITDIVAWLASHRTATPGQPYPQHP